jgi:hypothetical protein
MTREDAARVLRNLMDKVTIHDVDDWQDAVNAIEVALESIYSTDWVRTSERLPAEADTGDDGKILCVTVGVFGGTVILHVFWGIVAEHPERYPYWMPLPPLPESPVSGQTNWRGEDKR